MFKVVQPYLNKHHDTSTWKASQMVSQKTVKWQSQDEFKIDKSPDDGFDASQEEKRTCQMWMHRVYWQHLGNDTTTTALAVMLMLIGFMVFNAFEIVSHLKMFKKCLVHIACKNGRLQPLWLALLSFRSQEYVVLSVVRFMTSDFWKLFWRRICFCLTRYPWAHLYVLFGLSHEKIAVCAQQTELLECVSVRKKQTCEFWLIFFFFSSCLSCLND